MTDQTTKPVRGTFQDLTGYRFGLLVVESFAGITKKRTFWNVRCDCGRTKTVDAGNVKRGGGQQSCGCLRSINREGRFDYASIKPKEGFPVRKGKNAAAEQRQDVCEKILATFTYCPNDGTIRCKKTGALRLMKQDAGYYRVAISAGGDRFQMRAHRVAWFIAYGKWPMQIDHINGDRSDNRLENLRETNGQSRNGANINHHRDSTTGLKGVFPVRSKAQRCFRAQIMVNYTSIYLGMFDTKEKAAKAYNDAASFYFGEFARLNVLDGGQHD